MRLNFLSGFRFPVSAIACLLLVSSALAADHTGRDENLRDNTTGDKAKLKLHDNGDGTFSPQVYTGAGVGGGVTISDGADATQGAMGDPAASSDTGTFSIIALFKRSLQKLTSIATKLDSIITNTGAATPAGSNTIGNVGITGAQYTVAITVETANGSISAGKHHIEFILSSDFAGTIQDAAISGATLAVYSPGDPPVGSTLDAVSYTISAGNATITTW